MSDEIEILKKRNAKDSYDDFRVKEITKCMSDPLYFIENYMKIQHPTKGRVPFKLFPFQKKMIDTFHNFDSVIALTARQMGKCVVSKTKIKKDKDLVEMGSLVKLSQKERIVEWLERKLISLTQ